MKPVFAKGKSETCDTNGSIDQGATEIPVASAEQHFSEGDLIFLSDADLSDVECPGFAVAVSNTSITVPFGVKTARETEAKVWKPTNFFQWEIGRSSPLKRAYDSGTEILTTTGGVVYSTKIADARTIERLVFDKLTESCFSDYESWFKDTTGDGLDSFTYVDEARDVFTVRITNPDINRVETYPELVSLEINLAIEENAVYE